MKRGVPTFDEMMESAVQRELDGDGAMTRLFDAIERLADERGDRMAVNQVQGARWRWHWGTDKATAIDTLARVVEDLT